MNTAEFCRDAAAAPGSNFYYATLFHAPEERRALNALFALRAEIMRIAAGTPDAAVIAMRRSWWADELARLRTRQARHPIGLELQRLSEQAGIDIAALQYFAAAGGTASIEHGMRGLAGTGDGIWVNAARACGVSEPDALGAVSGAGELVDRLEIIATTPSAAMPRERLPQLIDDLGKDFESAGRALAARRAARAEFCGILTELSAALCAELARDTTVIGYSRVALTPLRKLWIAWRVHRRGAGT
jgi:phytoene synthase